MLKIDTYYKNMCSLLRGNLRPNFYYIWDIVSEIEAYISKNVSRFWRGNYAQIYAAFVAFLLEVETYYQSVPSFKRENYDKIKDAW